MSDFAPLLRELGCEPVPPHPHDEPAAAEDLGTFAYIFCVTIVVDERGERWEAPYRIPKEALSPPFAFIDLEETASQFH